MSEHVTAFPLCWPEGWPRCKHPEWSRFKVTPGVARDGLLDEIRKLGGKQPVLSTDIPLRNDGLPYASRRPPEDQGVAVYFTYKKRQMVFACDKWATIPENMQSIRKTIEALRGIERWGSSDMMERAFTGFTPLPPPMTGEPPWYNTLGVSPDASYDEVKAAYQKRRSKAHTDKGGNAHIFDRVQKAWDQYQEQRS